MALRTEIFSGRDYEVKERLDNLFKTENLNEHPENIVSISSNGQKIVEANVPFDVYFVTVVYKADTNYGSSVVSNMNIR